MGGCGGGNTGILFSFFFSMEWRSRCSSGCEKEGKAPERTHLGQWESERADGTLLLCSTEDPAG